MDEYVPTVFLQLTKPEARYISDVLDWWLSGYEEATNDVIEDRIHETPESMLEAVSGMHEQHDVAASLKSRLRRVLERSVH